MSYSSTIKLIHQLSHELRNPKLTRFQRAYLTLKKEEANLSLKA